MRRVGAILSLVALLAGCSALDPYSTYPSEPEANARDAGPRVAICYDTLVSTTAEVQKAAQQQCAGHTLATRVDTDWRLQFCPVLLPARATFVCAPQKQK